MSHQLEAAVANVSRSIGHIAEEIRLWRETADQRPAVVEKAPAERGVAAFMGEVSSISGSLYSFARGFGVEHPSADQAGRQHNLGAIAARYLELCGDRPILALEESEGGGDRG